MPKCERCGKYFDELDTRMELYNSYSYPMEYDNVDKCLCDECFREAMDDCESGVYHEVCEDCGKTFDFGSAKSEFLSIVSHFYKDVDLTLEDVCGNGKILCCDCALGYVDSEYRK